MKERIKWIDFAKFFCMYLVILSHTPLYTPVLNFVYTFHMPVFFFISGYLFNPEKYDSFSIFLKRRIKQLVIPYFIISLITYLFWFFVGSKFGDDADTYIAWYKPLLSSLIGNGSGMVHDIPLWFIAALFVAECMYFFLARYNKFFVLGLFILVAFLDYKLPYSFSFAVNVAFGAGIFYVAGNIMRNYLPLLLKKSSLLHLVLFLACLFITILISQLNGRINIYLRHYGNFFYFLVGGFSGILSFFLLCYYLTPYFYNRLTDYIGKNTLLVCGYQLMTFSFIKAIMVFILNISPDILNKTIGLNIIFSIVSLLLCIPIIYIINRFFPWMVGKNNLKIRV